MTTSLAHELEARRSPGRTSQTLAGSLADAFLQAAIELGSIPKAFTWPSARYRANPTSFCREVLGFEPWERQIQILELVRDCPRVAVSSGHKTGKSLSAAALALWFYCSFDDARVVMSSTTARQVDQILWREVRKLHTRAGRCTGCKREDEERVRQREPLGPRPCPHSALIDGEPREIARSGLRSSDFREIVGFTAREAEAVAGISGSNLLYILDEASGIPEVIFEAIDGNRAGGARIVLFSNPTKTTGEFYEAFCGKKSSFYKTITISSEETPNAVSGRNLIPGLATREWIEEKKLEYGPDSPFYRIRVLGQFVQNEDGKILSVHDILEAQNRWEETDDDGRLVIGLDPAGPGGAGDESAFAVRRGRKILELITMRGLTDSAHLSHLLGLLSRFRKPSEYAAVAIDREGPIGATIYGLLLAHAEMNRSDFQVVGVRASDRAQRNPTIYDRLRDELWANLADWIRNGGAIPLDTKLERELHEPEWTSHINGKLKVTGKDELRRALGRSPDRADAVILSCWVPDQKVVAPGAFGQSALDDDARVMNPYGALGPSSPNYISPYGSSNPWRRR